MEMMKKEFPANIHVVCRPEKLQKQKTERSIKAAIIAKRCFTRTGNCCNVCPHLRHGPADRHHHHPSRPTTSGIHLQLRLWRPTPLFPLVTLMPIFPSKDRSSASPYPTPSLLRSTNHRIIVNSSDHSPSHCSTTSPSSPLPQSQSPPFICFNRRDPCAGFTSSRNHPPPLYSPPATQLQLPIGTRFFAISDLNNRSSAPIPISNNEYQSNRRRETVLQLLYPSSVANQQPQSPLSPISPCPTRYLRLCN